MRNCRVPDALVDFHTDENGNGMVSYPEFKAGSGVIVNFYASMASHRSYPTQAWASDRLADVAVDDINYTTRSLVDVGAIQAKAQAKIGA